MDKEEASKRKSEIAQHLDFYGELLPEASREILELSMEEDLSLREIAAEMAISRQAVHDRILRSEEQLHRFEECLGMIARWRWQKAHLQRLRQAVQEGEQERILTLLDEYEAQLDE